MTSDAALRWVRALVLALVLFSSGLAGHAAADGVIPDASVLIPLFGITVVAAAPFAGASIGLARAAALVVGGQGLLHAALQLLGGTAGTATTTPCGATTSLAALPSPAHAHLMAHHCATASHGGATPLMSGSHLVMLLAHLAAAVVVGAWLVAGERALWVVLALTARPLVDAWRTVTTTACGGVANVTTDCPRLQLGWDLPAAVRVSMWAAGVVTRRGPPVCRVA